LVPDEMMDTPLTTTTTITATPPLLLLLLLLLLPWAYLGFQVRGQKSLVGSRGKDLAGGHADEVPQKLKREILCLIHSSDVNNFLQ